MNDTLQTDVGFWDRIAPKYSKKAVPDEKVYEQTLEHVRAHLRPEHRVLEVGCGTGSTALTLAPHCQELLATDASSGMIAIAEQKVAAQGIGNLSFGTGTLSSLSLATQSFDVVMAFNLFHLTSDLEQTMRDVHRFVKPGGLFISKTPCLSQGAMGLMRPVVALMRAFGKAPFVNFFSRAVLRDAVTGAGFEVLEERGFPAKGYNWFIVARKK